MKSAFSLSSKRLKLPSSSTSDSPLARLISKEPLAFLLSRTVISMISARSLIALSRSLSNAEGSLSLKLPFATKMALFRLPIDSIRLLAWLTILLNSRLSSSSLASIKSESDDMRRSNASPSASTSWREDKLVGSSAAVCTEAKKSLNPVDSELASLANKLSIAEVFSEKVSHSPTNVVSRRN